GRRSSLTGLLPSLARQLRGSTRRGFGRAPSDSRPYFFCVTVNVSPAIVKIPVRSAPVVFAATVYATVPFPVPLDPLVTMTQLALLPAVHIHEGCVVPEIGVPVLAALSSWSFVGEIE